MVRRAAFTLIELIFAIVIIGIVFLSLPSLSMSNADAVESGLVQEAIFASSAELSKALSYNWDDKSDANDTYAKVIDIATTNLGRNIDTYRVGHIQQSMHRRFHTNNTPASTANDTANNDIDEQAGSNNLFSETASVTGYKKAYTRSLSVSFSSDSLIDPYNFSAASAGGNSNMKMVTITVTDDKGVEITKLRSYAANIGGIDYYHEVY